MIKKRYKYFSVSSLEPSGLNGCSFLFKTFVHEKIIHILYHGIGTKVEGFSRKDNGAWNLRLVLQIFLSTHCTQANWTSEPAILWNARANDVIDSHICRVDNTINQGKLILPFPLIAESKVFNKSPISCQGNTFNVVKSTYHHKTKNSEK